MKTTYKYVINCFHKFFQTDSHLTSAYGSREAQISQSK